MIQKQVRHPAGSFSVCACGYEPRHILVLGRTARETSSSTPTERHMLECRCGRSTAMHGTLLKAEAEWGPVMSQRPLLLPTPVVPIRRRGARKEVRHG
jgi:hypothetical protein